MKSLEECGITKGPWEPDYHEGFVTHDIRSHGGKTGCAIVAGCNSNLPELNANIRMICAASKMYDALERILKYDGINFEEYRKAIEEAKAAMQIANGEIDIKI